MGTRTSYGGRRFTLDGESDGTSFRSSSHGIDYLQPPQTKNSFSSSLLSHSSTPMRRRASTSSTLMLGPTGLGDDGGLLGDMPLDDGFFESSQGLWSAMLVLMLRSSLPSPLW